MLKMGQKNILAVDSSTKACSVALNVAGRVYTRHEILPQKHAHRILPMVDEILQEAKLSVQQIDALSFGEGPGAFTGIRIAAGVIQGLALGWDKPVIALSSLSAISEEWGAEFIANSVSNELNVTQEERAKLHCCSMLDARMGELYLQCAVLDVETASFTFNETELLSPEDASHYLNAYKEAHNINAFYGAGDIADEYPQLTQLFTQWSSILPNAISLTKLAQVNFAKAKKLNEEIPTPVYLRNKIAETIEERRIKQTKKYNL